MQLGIAGRTFLVTGAAGGIGRAIASRLLDEGARVALLDLDPAALKSVATDLGADDRVLVTPADVTDLTEVDSAVEQVIRRWTTLNGVAHSAGINSSNDGAAADVSTETFVKLVSVNLTGTFHIAKATIPLLLEAGGGTIVNVSSAGALPGVKNGGATAYNAGKAGILGLTRSVAAQYAEQNLRCIAVCPGAIDTPMLAAARAKLGHSAVQPPRTLQRAGQPEEVAALIALLLSDAGSFASGASWAFDGNMTGY